MGLVERGCINVDLHPEDIFSGLLVTPAHVGSELAVCISRVLQVYQDVSQNVS